MSLALKAARGAIWVIASNVGARVVGLVSTLVVLRFVSPADYGAVSVASVIAISADSFTAFGIFRYLMANPKAPQEIIFHSFVFHVLIGLTSLSIAVAMRHYWAGLSNAPLAAAYIPGMALSMTFLRLGFPAEQLLARELRFRPVGMARGLAEVVYSTVAVVLALLGFGGYALVYGNIAQWLVFLVILWWAADVKQLYTPCKLSWEHTRTIFGFVVSQTHPMWRRAASIAC
ncbi:MAG: oligosaccharide flippase family protein [Deltaproteobacteria bacterium]|nr:oligosaccharide flippase family protein [Deltaproteobacteria bacterium]